MGLGADSYFFAQSHIPFLSLSLLKKFLIIRFSSIGDIVLTTPVIRCLKNKYPEAQIHYLTKKSFSSVIVSNPFVNKVYSIEKEVNEIATELKSENYDFVIDLHKNIRSRRTKRIVESESASFSKLNWEKWLLTNFKINKMPDVHIVERYLDTLANIGVVNDYLGLDFFISKENEVQELPFSNYTALVVGAAHETKAMTVSKMLEIVDSIDYNFILIGGPGEKAKADEIIRKANNRKIFNACGVFNIEQSAHLLKESTCVITPDTGMMHIASALHKPVVSIWGNTVPEFGMYPYIPQNKDLVKIIEVKDLNCRPCSKIGYSNCPKKHFKCIEKLDVNDIRMFVEKYIN